jgi:hypothetical protein
LEIYRAACRIQRDGRLSAAGRAGKVVGLDDEIVDWAYSRKGAIGNVRG